MPEGSIWKISAVVSPEQEEQVSEIFETLLNVLPVSYVDAETGRTEVSVYLANSSDWNPQLRKRLVEALPDGLRLVAQKLKRERWADSWKKHFHPLTIRRALLIKPSWSKRRPAPGMKQIILDPGLSFGTGQHPTTRFCLDQLALRRRHRLSQSFMDVGCGSGILSIAAAKLGYHPVQALDNDAEAVRIARQNAARNRVADKIVFQCQDLGELSSVPHRTFEVICANLIFDVLIENRARLICRLKPGGLLVLAGILRSQYVEVQKCFERGGLSLHCRESEGEWESASFSAT